MSIPVIESRFDALGNRTHIGSSMGADIGHQFDVWGNTIGRQSKGWQSQIIRDKFGLEQETLLPGGISSHWKRDQRGRISAHWVNKANNQPPAPLRDHQYLPDLLRSVKYEWDTEDRLKSLTDPLGGMMQFEHDSFGNLTKTIFGDGKAQLRNPDPVGNLFETKDRTDRKYDKGGKLLESNGATYKYDKEGNLIEKKEKNGRLWQYEWNAAGMLAKVTRPDKDQVTFGYDALGRRISKRFYNTITRWTWDGNKPLHEWKEHALTGDILSNTTIGADGVITWLFDEDSFAPVAKLKGDKKYSIITDHLGTPVQMYQEDGTKFWQGELDSYGRMRMERGEAGSCPFRYQGQYEDKETGLYYNRFRYYAPEEGMYISQDPIRLMGGEDNLYAYVSDPNCWVDIFGLQTTYGPGFEMTSKRKTNKREGRRREDTFGKILEEKHGADRVLNERTLLDSNGSKVTSGGTGRRIDFVVLDGNGNAVGAYEVTSKTADKAPQTRKETNIRNNGGTFIRDGNGDLVDLSTINTQIIRIK